MDAQTISAAQGASTAALSSEADIPLPRSLAAQLQSEFSNHTPERLEQECCELVQTTAQAALELGKRLLMLKEIAGHGNWLLTLQRIGINATSAARVMRAVVRILSLPDHARLVTAAKSKSKLLELLVLDEEELQCLNLGEAVRGISLATLPNNSVANLRSMLRDKATAVSAPVTPPNAAAVVGMATSVPLVSGDQVKSLHAGRQGKVVKVYPDGSACVCWDDGEPQEEGLGHERIPRQSLILTECAPVKAVATEAGEAKHLRDSILGPVKTASADALIGDDPEVTAPASRHVWHAATDTPVTDTRVTCAVMLKENTRMPNKLMLSAHTLASLADNPEVRIYLPIHQHGPATLGQLQIILGVTEIEVNDAVKTPILTYDRSTFELYGEAEPTPAPFSGRIDPGTGSRIEKGMEAPATRQLESGDRFEFVPEHLRNYILDLEARIDARNATHRLDRIDNYPAVFSMARGQFSGREVTLMIHAGKTWMIAEEIAAVLGETPEEIKEIEGIIGRQFERQAFPDAYTVVRIASTTMAARLLDGMAIGLLAGTLDTPAAMALSEWMDEMSSPGEGWSPAEDEPAELSDSFAELQSILDAHAKVYAKEHNLSYGEAIGTICGQTIAKFTPPDESLHPDQLLTRAPGVDGFANNADLIGQPAMAPKDAAVLTLVPVPAQTLDDCLAKLGKQHGAIQNLLYRVEDQTKAIKVISSLNEEDQGGVSIYTLAEVAADIVAHHEELMEEIDNTLCAIKKRLFSNPEPGMKLPESVWLNLVSSLLVEKTEYFDSDMCHLAKLATTLDAYASSSPEVTAALVHLEAFVERHGAILYHHAPSNSRAFSWMPGKSPADRFKASRSR